ncbi:MAG: helicase-associated domain-containing protein [Anaerolineales bacterium]|nr:helicase-associated domain-containing protein [Anaerolineales bacterium]
MPDLTHALLNQDIGHLRIIADLWGLELDSTDADSARDELTASLLDFNLLAELLDSLSPQADSVLAALIASNGRIPWATFTRQFGDIREMGAGKRDREHPHLNPISAAEILFYRGLLARAFFETDKGSQEFAYIPDDLFELISHRVTESLRINQKESPRPRDSAAKIEPLGRPAAPNEKGKEFLADDSILDDATTMLAALRMGKTLESASLLAERGEQAPRLQSLLTSANLASPSPAGRGVRGEGEINPEAVKTFLESPRADALKLLHDAWLESDSFNELKLMPSIICEGEWRNQPQETREFLLNLLDAIPEGKWWSANAFVRDIKQKYPDFQRPASDYDSWFIKRASDGQYLRGFDSWNEVDGALIRYFINILYWLGEVDLGFAEGAEEATAFRIKSKVESQRSDLRPLTFDEKGKISVSSNGKLTVERTAPRVVRYQIARFCEWEASGLDTLANPARYSTTKDVYKYQITARSLKRAKEQGLKAEQLLSLLVKHTEGKVPPTVVKALKRWEAHGTEARVETQTILRVSQPEVLEEMRKSRAGKFLGEVLSPTAVIVKSGAIQKAMEAMIELGLFAEIETLVE